MLTRCPHCRTLFRVTAAQLKIRQGRVRCGGCRENFDALDSLDDEAHFALEPVVPEPVVPEPVVPEPVVPEPAPAAAARDWPPVPAAPAPPRRWPWIGGIFVLLLVALGQLTYTFRSEIALLAPALRPALVAACELIGCTLARPARPDLIGIENSDLAPEGETLLLTATLKNSAPFAQDFPHLELTLTDARDVALVRKVLAPPDYLPPGAVAAQGFAARSDLALRLHLATDNLPAVGYRLYLFFP